MWHSTFDASSTTSQTDWMAPVSGVFHVVFSKDKAMDKKAVNFGIGYFTVIERVQLIYFCLVIVDGT